MLGKVELAFLALLLAPPFALAQAPRFTDEDLARYREKRLREAAPAEPTPAAPDPALPPAAFPTPAPSGAVELLDLNRTLPAEARTAAEAAGRHFRRFFGAPGHGTLVIPLRYFPDWGAYRDYLVRNQPLAGDWTGFYDPLKREIVVGQRWNTQAILAHEINHFVFDTVFHEAPVWLREGLAEYFETSTSTPEGLDVADQPRHRKQLAEWLQGSRQPDLRQLLALNWSGWTDHELAGAQRVRALSWSVVDFLMTTPGGRPILQQFIATLKDQRGLWSLEALSRTFPGGAAAFERRWLQHVEARVKPD